MGTAGSDKQEVCLNHSVCMGSTPVLIHLGKTNGWLRQTTRIALFDCNSGVQNIQEVSDRFKPSPANPTSAAPPIAQLIDSMTTSSCKNLIPLQPRPQKRKLQDVRHEIEDLNKEKYCTEGRLEKVRSIIHHAATESPYGSNFKMISTSKPKLHC